MGKPLSAAQESRNALGGIVRRKDATPADIERARQDLAFAKAERMLATMGAPLRPEQKVHLALLALAGEIQ